MYAHIFTIHMNDCNYKTLQMRMKITPISVTGSQNTHL